MLERSMASQFSRMVLAGIGREYPNKLDHVLNEDADLRSPRVLHPAFFGCFDWHSAVHGHWLLARVVRRFPDLAEAAQINAVLDEHLSAENIAVETAYLSRPNSGSFERMYGWAWLLKLAEELGRASGTSAMRRAAALAPLAGAFVARYLAFLPRLDYPIRTGVHPNTAFGLAFAHDYAVSAGHAELRRAVEHTAHRLFARDEAYPAQLEPGGADFFSPALLQADLMRRIIGPAEFSRWFGRFLPGVGRGDPANLFTPARVSDRTDLQIIHLDGLNLSRAWCMRSIANALADGDPAVAALRRSADAHAAAALPNICSGHYGGEHWLATFAVLAQLGDG